MLPERQEQRGSAPHVAQSRSVVVAQLRETIAGWPLSPAPSD